MIRERLGKELLYFDGGMGTLLQAKGLQPGELPETWNVTHADEIRNIHKQYISAGSDIVLANTFGANALKFHCDDFPLEEIICLAIRHVKDAAEEASGGRRIYTALDVGPTGKLLKPMGDLDFETAYETFKEVMILGEKAGADLIHIETMSDTYELKAAVLAAKENTSLPVFATTIFDERGKLLTGADVPSVVAMLEGLRIDALGINCGMGPEQMLPILEQIMKYSSVPVIVKPNAGLPKQKDGETYYDVSPEEFASVMRHVVDLGAVVIGGCCGTTPEHIAEMVKQCKDIPVKPVEKKNYTVVSSYGQSVFLGTGSKIIGERINPTGKKRFKQALKEHDLDYILKEGISQQEAGADVLDVNVGLPEINECEMLVKTVRELQSVSDLPLQLDTSDDKAMEAALRIYNGKALINSVNGKKESMEKIFPLAAKYGGVIIALTLDESGIPDTADGRIKIAENIISCAEKYGISKNDIIVDPLAMTVSSNSLSAAVTLDCIEELSKRGIKTSLGVSNVSFGLPQRDIVNSAFFVSAMQKGLGAAIMNPHSKSMKDAYYGYLAISDLDPNFERYIGYASLEKPAAPIGDSKQDTSDSETLKKCILKGLKDESATCTQRLLSELSPIEIIDSAIIPALDETGARFEKKTLFLPQLLMSAEAAKSAFEVIKSKLLESGEKRKKKMKIVIATVKGDIHDIGKNIVKTLLQNYDFDVIDLGKDVPPELIAETAFKEKAPLVGLSALMTTTVPAMEETIKQLRSKTPDCRIVVGGAVLTKEYADMIGADKYAKDAMETVRYAEALNDEIGAAD